MPSKTFRRTVVPPSTRSLLNLTLFVVSAEDARGEGQAAAIESEACRFIAATVTKWTQKKVLEVNKYCYFKG